MLTGGGPVLTWLEGTGTTDMGAGVRLAGMGLPAGCACGLGEPCCMAGMVEGGGAGELGCVLGMNVGSGLPGLGLAGAGDPCSAVCLGLGMTYLSLISHCIARQNKHRTGCFWR